MKLIKSFYHAICGIGYCIRQERNFRVHVTAAVTVLLFSVFYGLPWERYPAVILVIALVLTMESVNTAIERAVDLSSPERHTLAKAAKDTAAAGVLLAALGAIGVACFTFSEPDKLLAVLARFRSPLMLTGLIGYILVFAVFVFGWNIKEKK